MTEWSRSELAVVTAAVRGAPSVHNTQPWVVEFHDGHRASLFERFDRRLPRHDPLGRDRLISCGAALANLVLALRVLGWQPELRLLGNRSRPDEVAEVTVSGRVSPSTMEDRWYAAITRRRSYRRPFAALPVEKNQRDLLVRASSTDGVQARPVTRDGERAVLAGLLSYAAGVLRADRGYQRELAAWTASVSDPRPGDGVALVPPRESSLPWAGLVRRSTALPDVATLTERLSDEYLLLLETPDDGPADHVLAGMAMQRIWLAATHAGLVGSVLTQPIQLPEVRAGLIERLTLPGFPQLFMRFGYPVDTSPPRQPQPIAIPPAIPRPDHEETLS